MAKVTKHGGPTHAHFEWVPINRPQLGGTHQCHGGSSTTPTVKQPIESEQTEQPQLPPALLMENPSLPTDQSESVDSVGVSTPAMGEIEAVPPKKRATTRRKKLDDFDF